MAIVNLLDRRMYAMSDVDRLLRLNGGTARRWIDGYTRAGKPYAPVIRLERTGDDVVTWGEFTEARLLAEFRESGVTLQNLRPAIARLRENWGTPYPLAHRRAFLTAEGRELVETVQDEFEVPREVQIVRRARDGQLQLTAAAAAFSSATVYSPKGFAVGFQPLQAAPAVFIDPERQAGRPIVGSVPTDVLADLFRAGDGVDTIALAYDLEPDLVEQAIRFELQTSHAA